MSKATDEIDVETVEAGIDEVVTNDEAKPQKAPARKRGDLPEGYITPIGFAKLATELKLHTDRQGGHEVKPQMVYSYMRNAPKDDPFPILIVQDSNGDDRQVVKPEDAVAWWTRKNERVAGRRANAAEKAEAKNRRAAEKAEAGEAVEAEEVTEVE